MKYAQHILFCEDIEIDEVFSKLQTIEPPPSLVDSILASVAQLPPYPLQPTQPTGLLHDAEGLVIWHDCLNPS